ncbi:MAG: hypothetical protein GEV12_13705 [Micromonosporaceae bacterium]|nr:hypothetical protein [Micromonosporaceae bacterium]
MTTGSPAMTRSVLVSRAGAGVIGGLVGGIVFGLMTAADDMLPMIAMLVGAESVAVGWLVHFAIAIFIGGTFAVIFGRLARSWWVSTGIGLLYGALWWVLGSMLIMPLWLELVGNEGMAEMVLVWNDTTRNSLWGHLVFGVLLGLVYGLLGQRMATRS